MSREVFPPQAREGTRTLWEVMGASVTATTGTEYVSKHTPHTVRVKPCQVSGVSWESLPPQMFTQVFLRL